MTPAVLLREGYDLDELLDELDREHGGVRVVDVRHEREGGVLGFFARRKVAVSYTIPQENAVPESLTDFDQDATNTEFARMLLEMAAAKAADRRAEADADEDGDYAPKHGASGAEPTLRDFVAEAIPGRSTACDELNAGFDQPDTAPRPRTFAEFAAAQAGATAPTAPTAPAAPISPAVAPAPAARSQSAHTQFTRTLSAPAAAAGPAAPTGGAGLSPLPPTPPRPLAASGLHGAQLRARLLDLGVPVGWLPADLSDPTAAVAELAGRVPVATPPFAPGSVLVVAGPAALVVEAARQVRDRLRIDRPLLGVGIEVGVDAVIRDEAAAAALRWDADGSGSAVVAVALPEPAASLSSRDTQQRILRHLAADATWLLADARWRTADIRAVLAQVRADALAVLNAAEAASPAAPWELGLPIALVDGRPATPHAWNVLLLDRLAG